MAEEKKENSTVTLPSFYGVKVGMTRIFEAKRHVPVTVIELIPNLITQVKTLERDTYQAYQIGYGEKRERLLKKPIRGILKRAQVKNPLTRFFEVRMADADPQHLGREVSLEKFSARTFVDVTGISKGKGFQGVIKRWNFAQGPLSHGSKLHRTGGSIGNRTTPGRVWKNKKMPGHMGVEQITVLNLQIVSIDPEKGYLLIEGAVPGAKNSFVRIRHAIKKYPGGRL